jgi:hypothetical protein
MLIKSETNALQDAVMMYPDSALLAQIGSNPIHPRSAGSMCNSLPHVVHGVVILPMSSTPKAAGRSQKTLPDPKRLQKILERNVRLEMRGRDAANWPNSLKGVNILQERDAE